MNLGKEGPRAVLRTAESRGVWHAEAGKWIGTGWTLRAQVEGAEHGNRPF